MFACQINLKISTGKTPGTNTVLHSTGVTEAFPGIQKDIACLFSAGGIKLSAFPELLSSFQLTNSVSDPTLDITFALLLLCFFFFVCFLGVYITYCVLLDKLTTVNKHQPPVNLQKGNRWKGSRKNLISRGLSRALYILLRLGMEVRMGSVSFTHNLLY